MNNGQPTPPAAPTPPTPYEQVIRVAATAIANAYLAKLGHRPAANVLEVVSDDVRRDCILFATAAVQAVSRHGEKVAQSLAAKVDPTKNCAKCGQTGVMVEEDEATHVRHVTFECGAEVLVFPAGNVATRRECPHVATDA